MTIDDSNSLGISEMPMLSLTPSMTPQQPCMGNTQYSQPHFRAEESRAKANSSPFPRANDALARESLNPDSNLTVK